MTREFTDFKIGTGLSGKLVAVLEHSYPSGIDAFQGGGYKARRQTMLSEEALAARVERLEQSGSGDDATLCRSALTALRREISISREFADFEIGTGLSGELVAVLEHSYPSGTDAFQGGGYKARRQTMLGEEALAARVERLERYGDGDNTKLCRSALTALRATKNSRLSPG